MTRWFLFCILTIIAATGPVWLFVAGLIAYGAVFSGLELILLGLFVDAFFMNSHAVLPMYTLIATGWLIVVELVKPHIVLYNQT